MAPNSSTTVLTTTTTTTQNPPEDLSSGPTSSTTAPSADDKEHKTVVVWHNVIIFSLLHIYALYGAYLAVADAMWQTNVFAWFLYIFSGFGITAGAHRLWAHRSYKAKLPLRILLAFLNTVAFEKDIFDWSREHRVHHKFTDTDADPHNAKRGFFFSHIGWLLCRKHPDVITKGRTVDLSDILADPVVAFQRKYYYWLVTVCCIILPTIAPFYLWGDSMWNAFFVAGMLRYVWTLNCSFLVNSAAHKWGDKPYDTAIKPAENLVVSYWAIGEGFHNYHHTFPWDYSTSEYGVKLNITTAFINFFAWLGWAYDLKTAPKEIIQHRKLRTGELKDK